MTASLKACANASASGTDGFDLAINRGDCSRTQANSAGKSTAISSCW
jgi:hypothetical protein